MPLLGISNADYGLRGRALMLSFSPSAVLEKIFEVFLFIRSSIQLDRLHDG